MRQNHCSPRIAVATASSDYFTLYVFKSLIIYIQKFLDSDMLREMQF